MNLLKIIITALSFVSLSTSMSSASLIDGDHSYSNQFANDSYTYQHSGSDGNGDIRNTSVFYNAKTQDFQMNYDLKKDSGVDFMWTVVSDGIVKGSQNHAILYMDLKNNQISAYRYDTELGGNSFKNGDLLATFRNDSTNMISDESFTINVGGINSAFDGDWEGVEIGENGGIWFHSARESAIEYNDKGHIVSLDFEGKSYVDKANFKTDFKEGEKEPKEETSVPAPLGIFAIVAAFGLVRLKRRQSLAA